MELLKDLTTFSLLPTVGREIRAGVIGLVVFALLAYFLFPVERLWVAGIIGGAVVIFYVVRCVLVAKRNRKDRKSVV